LSVANERVAYFNGRILPESQATVSFRDRGFKYGDAVFDATRTFGGRPFLLDRHVDRLYRSLRYLRIDAGLSPREMIEISEEVLERNRPLLGADGDYWISQRITRGVDAVGGELWESAGGPTVIVECTPLPLKARAVLFRDGAEIVAPSVRRAAPDSVSPNAKTHNYLNLVLGDLEARALNPKAWAVLLDVNGNLSEGIGSNVFIIEAGAVVTPSSEYVLEGITRNAVIELAGKLGMSVLEESISPYRAANADEAFITSTSLCICPVRSINGRPLREASVPGPATKRLMEAFRAMAEFDYVGQYLRHL
jgi:branched-chain amino acid aminotransferase